MQVHEFTMCPQSPDRVLAGSIASPRCSPSVVGQNFKGVVYRCNKHNVAFTARSLQTAIDAARYREEKRKEQEARKVA